MKIKTGLKYKTLQGKEVVHGGCPTCGNFCGVCKNAVSDRTGETLTLGEVLAEVVLAKIEKDGFRPLKGWELAQKFYKDKEVEVDDSELIQIKELLPKTGFANSVIGQTEKMLADIKEDKVK